MIYVLQVNNAENIGDDDMNKPILNLHGLYGDPENTNYKLLKSIGEDVISPSIDYVNICPETIINNLLSISSGVKYIAGQSLGGFFALCLSDIIQVPCLVTNPCVPPQNYIPNLVPDYEYTQNLIDMQAKYSTMYTTDNRDIHMILGCKDEVLDYRFTKSLIDTSAVRYVEDGKHSLSDSKNFRTIFLEEVGCI